MIMEKKRNSASPTRVPLICGATARPIIDLELEYEDPIPPEGEQAKNGKAKAAQARKKKPAKRRKTA
jgi:hypothetical protein